MEPTKIAFEKRYSDDSGVEFAVRYDGTKPLDQIEIERVNSVSFPLEQLRWLIACLQRIKDEIELA